MRLVKHERNHPFVVKVADLPGFAGIAGDAEKLSKYEIHLCACGLSKHKPFCDGSHRYTQNEEQGRVFAYSSENKRIDITDKAKEIANELPNEYE
ncbi:MAG: CDGSH iron-sulfur domain-containing protein [Candidatus Micrarchaeaceae archaeon]